MRPVTKLTQRKQSRAARTCPGILLFYSLIAPLGVGFATEPCAVPQHRTVKSFTNDPDEINLHISIDISDFAPSRLACLGAALKKAYPGRSVSASIFGSYEAAQHYTAIDQELAPLEIWAQEQLHAEFSYDKWDGEEFVKILPGGQGRGHDSRWDTRINLPVSGTPTCNLAISSRCLLAFEPIFYTRREDKRNGEGSVTVLGALQPDGSLTELRAIDTRANVPDQRAEFVDHVLNNLKTWHFAPAARPELFRITYRFASLPGWTVNFHLPEEVVVRCGDCGRTTPRGTFVGHFRRTDGPGILILGGLIGFAALVFCFGNPRCKRFALAGLVSPIAASLVFLIGLFVLADMNPATGIGAQYVFTGKEQDPTTFDNTFWLGSTAATFLLCGFACVKVQEFWGALVERGRRKRVSRAPG